jgi:hypothetical protein
LFWPVVLVLATGCTSPDPAYLECRESARPYECMPELRAQGRITPDQWREWVER